MRWRPTSGSGPCWRTSSVSIPDRDCSELEQQILVHDPALGIGDRAARALEAHAPAGNLPSISVELVGRESEIAAVSRPARSPAAGRDRRTGRDREDRGRDRHRSQAGRVGRCRARWRLVGQARNRDDRGRRPRHGDHRTPRHGRRGGAVRAAQGLRRGRDPRQLRARSRRCRGARGPPPRRRPLVRILCTSQVPLDVDGEAVFELAPLALSEAVELFTRRAARAAAITAPARPTTRCTTCAVHSTACRWRSSSPRHAPRRCRSRRSAAASTIDSTC